VTALVDPVIHKLEAGQSLGRKMYAAHQDYMLDYVVGDYWGDTNKVEYTYVPAEAGYTVPYDTFATRKERITQRWPNPATGAKVIGTHNPYQTPTQTFMTVPTGRTTPTTVDRGGGEHTPYTVQDGKVSPSEVYDYTYWDNEYHTETARAGDTNQYRNDFVNKFSIPFHQCNRYECRWEDTAEYLTGLSGVARAMYRIWRDEHNSAENRWLRSSDVNGTHTYYQSDWTNGTDYIDGSDYVTTDGQHIASPRRSKYDIEHYPDVLQPQCVKDTCIYNKPDTYILYQRNDCVGKLTDEKCIVQCLNGYRNMDGYRLSEEITCLTNNYFQNSTVRCERQTCMRFEKQAQIFAQAYHIDARDCGIGLTAPTRSET
jgi:hypothetical protein